MTQSIAVIPPDGNETVVTQCNLCLFDITFHTQDETVVNNGYVLCPHCNYHQPTTKRPRGRDMAVFGVAIAAVYITTIVAILISR